MKDSIYISRLLVQPTNIKLNSNGNLKKNFTITV